MFNSDLTQLLKHNKVETNSKILSLNPFVDEFSLIRVGGRLSRSEFDFDKKHQILLPRHHPLTDLIAINAHVNNLHCGSQHLLYTLREKY